MSEMSQSQAARFQVLERAVGKIQNTADGRPDLLTRREAAVLVEYIEFQAGGGRWLVMARSLQPGPAARPVEGGA